VIRNISANGSPTVFGPPGGFRAYAKGWRHFTLRGEPFPETYFDVPVR